MNKTLAEGVAFCQQLTDALAEIDEDIQPFVIPPFTLAREVARKLSTTRIKVGAQNMHWADDGAWTGEISAPMLKDCGLDLVELGHSERRTHFGETDKTVGLKVAAAIRHGLVPLVCVGETLQERDQGQATQVLTAQTVAALGELELDELRRPFLLAYEPVWAIGEGGVPASAEYANNKHALIKDVIRVMTEPAESRGTPPADPVVLYGGSVGPSNVGDLLAQPDIDGLFIGRAAWQSDGYLNILRLAQSAVAKQPVRSQQ